MSRLGIGFVLAAALAAAATAGSAGASAIPDPTGFGDTSEPAPLAPPSLGSALALPLATPTAKAPEGGGAEPAAMKALTAERAQILLRSLTVPGWGQATLGHNTSAAVFATIEAAVWTSFIAFQVQDKLRTDSYERTALYQAGIDLDHRDEEFRRIVGSYLSSDDYNLYVVARDAANLWYDNPDSMEVYIDRHSLKGDNAWHWQDEQSLMRYRDQRKDAQHAQQRANTALAVAVANRLVSALHAARIASHPPKKKATSWQFEIAPSALDFTAFKVGVRARF